MTKHSNPFYTIGESISVLQSLGVSPQCNIPEDQLDWREEIISVAAHRVYEGAGATHHFMLEIHIDYVGLEEVYRKLQAEGVTVTVGPHSDEYDKVTLKLGSMLEMFALVPKGKDITL